MAYRFVNTLAYIFGHRIPDRAAPFFPVHDPGIDEPFEVVREERPGKTEFA